MQRKLNVWSCLITRLQNNMIIQKKQINHSGNVAKFKYLGMMVTDHIFTNDKIESRLNSRNTCYRSVQNLWSSCLLSRNIKDYNHTKSSFTCCSVWVWNLVSQTEGRTQTESAWEQGAEENIWTQDGFSDRRLEKTVYGDFHNLSPLPNIIMLTKSRTRLTCYGVGKIRNAYKTWVGKP
jgi:hypothetical protein